MCEDSCYPSEPLAVHCFEDKLTESAIVGCVSTTSAACDAIRSQVLLQMWGNSLPVCIEVNVIDYRTVISLEVTNTRPSR
jgi:hypothetical protein